MYFDRRISERLLSELEAGAFSWLPTTCRDCSRVDLQLRGYPKEPDCRVTAYVGTTKVLDVYEKNGLFRVKAGTSAQRWSGVPLPWATLSRYQPLKDMAPHLDDLAKHTAKAASAVPTRWASNEGRLQTLVAKHAFPGVIAIDREAVIGFSSNAEKEQVRDELISRFASVLTRMRKQWAQPNARQSWKEADFLALDADGRLLVIEVKRGQDKSLPWAAAQVAYCTALFRRWATEVGEAAAAKTIEQMLEQRQRLQIIPDRPPVVTPLTVLPVVAVGTPTDPDMLRQLRVMAEALEADAQLGCGPIEVWSINPDNLSLTIDEVN